MRPIRRTGARAAAQSLAVTFALLLPPAAAGQSEWVAQSPYPADDHVHDVFFQDAANGWLVGSDGIFMRTADGGRTWEQHTSFERSCFGDEIVYFIEFVDEQQGFAAGHNLFRTTNACAAGCP